MAKPSAAAAVVVATVTSGPVVVAAGEHSGVSPGGGVTCALPFDSSTFVV